MPRVLRMCIYYSVFFSLTVAGTDTQSQTRQWVSTQHSTALSEWVSLSHWLSDSQSLSQWLSGSASDTHVQCQSLSVSVWLPLPVSVSHSDWVSQWAQFVNVLAARMFCRETGKQHIYRVILPENAVIGWFTVQTETLCMNKYDWPDITGLDIGLVGPVARGASRFENLLAPQKTYWPRGPVDLKTYWPPKNLLAPQKTNWSLPQNQTCATKNYLHKPTICT